MNLTDFLLARIAEDEAAAQTALGEPSYSHYGETAAEECWRMAKEEGCSPDGYRFHRRHDPARVLAECAAKRAIVSIHSGPDYRRDRPDLHLCQDSMTHVNDCDTLRALALPYSDHPDYDEERKP